MLLANTKSSERFGSDLYSSSIPEYKNPRPSRLSPILIPDSRDRVLACRTHRFRRNLCRVQPHLTPNTGGCHGRANVHCRTPYLFESNSPRTRGAVQRYPGEARTRKRQALIDGRSIVSSVPTQCTLPDPMAESKKTRRPARRSAGARRDAVGKKRNPTGLWKDRPFPCCWIPLHHPPPPPPPPASPVSAAVRGHGFQVRFPSQCAMAADG